MRLFFPLLLAACAGEKTIDEGEVIDTGGIVETPDADADGYDEDEDCDDGNSVVNPGAEEICDGIDNNCDGVADEGVTTTFYADTDGDGFGDADSPIEACEQPAGYVPIGNDCDDANEGVYPSAPEECDGLDNDCDGEIDDGLLSDWYADGDGDGYGDPDSVVESCDPKQGYIADGSDCDDTDPDAFPGGVEVCDEADNDCDGAVDEDVTTTYYEDVDGDGFGVSDITTESCDLPTGYAEGAGDCDDLDEAINPDAEEVCDDLDNDCDGTIDEDDATDASTWYADVDGDGYGDASASTLACDQPSNTVSDATDCDDTESASNPGETEVCDDIDNDCDGSTDEGVTTTFYADADGDGFGDIDTTAEECSQPSGYTTDTTDCDDGDSAINPDAAEVCDGDDNDCDGTIDEDDATDAATWYADADGDGYGDVDSTTASCDQPTGYVSDDSDCDDAEEAANPGESEVCDEIDNDCDGSTDEGVTTTYYEDADTDGYGNADATTEGCDVPSGYTDDDTDCDDTESTTNPGAEDLCDGEDNDCDGSTDEGATENAWLASYYGGVFYELDPDGETYTELTAPDDSSLSSYSSNGLASSLDGGGIAYVHDSTDNRLLELNVCDEELTELGDTNVGNTCGIAFGPDGGMYGVDTANDTLVVFDLSDGSATEVGDLGFDLQNCALTYDCATDTLIGMQVDTSDSTGLLFSIDASTGAATEEVTLDSTVTWTSAGLQYDPPTGMYFASTDEGVFEVDIADGSATEVIDLSTNNLTYIVDECN